MWEWAPIRSIRVRSLVVSWWVGGQEGRGGREGGRDGKNGVCEGMEKASASFLENKVVGGENDWIKADPALSPGRHARSDVQLGGVP